MKTVQQNQLVGFVDMLIDGTKSGKIKWEYDTQFNESDAPVEIDLDNSFGLSKAAAYKTGYKNGETSIELLEDDGRLRINLFGYMKNDRGEKLNFSLFDFADTASLNFSKLCQIYKAVQKNCPVNKVYKMEYEEFFM